jgi:glycine/D-amino acid oxidase-like deaminating enzyme
VAEGLDWVIVGGGIHGVHLAARLLDARVVAPERIRLVDPEAQLLGRWAACTAATGMTHLRSPGVHHLDIDPYSLLKYGAARRRRPRGLPRAERPFVPPYDRPSLALFAAHSAQVIARYALAELHLRDRVVGLRTRCDEVELALASGAALGARNVVLALGLSQQPRWPAFAAPLRGGAASHVFDPAAPLVREDLPSRILVVGAGISGAQTALALAAAGRDVTMLSRHPLREHQFDSEPGWLGPRFMVGFEQLADPDARRATITAARHRGSMPPDVRRDLNAAIERGDIHFVRGEVRTAEPSPTGLRVELADAALEVDHVVLATGFEPGRPGGALVDALARSGLPCARCGYPIVDRSLRWHPRVFVSGPLAELELGPAARNIAGARRAADRVVAAATST